MSHDPPDTQSKENLAFDAWDNSQHQLSLVVSILRSWAVAPEALTNISKADRDNLILNVLAIAESAQSSLKASRPTI